MLETQLTQWHWYSSVSEHGERNKERWLYEWNCCSSLNCVWLRDPMDCSMPGFSVLPCLPEFAQTQVHWVDDAIKPSHALLPSSFSSRLQSYSVSESFPMSQFFTSGGPSIGASASASVLPMNIQGWFPLGLTGLISLQSKGLSSIFSSTTIRKDQFFGTQPSLWFNSQVWVSGQH